MGIPIKQCVQAKPASKDTSEFEETVLGDSIFVVEKNFDSFFSTIILFIEQDPFFKVAMNLDVNFQQVHQENYKANEHSNIKDTVFQENGNSFQNTPIHLLFYEKINNTNLTDHQMSHKKLLPILSSMSWCKLKKGSVLNIDELAYTLELRLVLDQFSAQFVTSDQYQQLLFILGQKINSHDENEQDYEQVLTLFKSFNTCSIESFKSMINQLQFPFIYDKIKSLAENRHDFQDFFSCLTNIRCAVIEGAHCCEAACQLLHGYDLGDPVPLDEKRFNIPSNSTLFKKVGTQVYYFQEEDMILSDDVLNQLKKISEELAEQKDLIVHVSWHSFFNKLADDINMHANLNKLLYDTQEEFFKEEIHYREISSEDLISNHL